MRVRFIINKNAPGQVKSACDRACENLKQEELSAKVTEYATGHADEKEAVGGSNQKQTLHVTDSPEMLHLLQEQVLPVIALSHEGNPDADLSGAAYVFCEPDEIDVDSYVKAYERLAGIPWKILETERLLVRETTVEDVDSFYEIYADPSMTKYMEGLFEKPEDEKRYMRDYIQNVYGLMGFGVWTVILKETGEVIGRAGFSIRNGFDKPELGFLIGVNWQGCGLAQEVLRAVLGYGRDILGFESVQALVKEGNEESVHILKKLGFEVCGFAKAEENIYGDSYAGMGASGEGVSRSGTYIEMILEMVN